MRLLLKDVLIGEINSDKIYALVFEKRAPVDFMNRTGFARSAAFLRVNKAISSEARVFVYSQNRFCFGYNFNKSGNYYGEYYLKKILFLFASKSSCRISPGNKKNMILPRPVLLLQPLPRTSNADSKFFAEPVWKELGWSHIRRFLTDIGPENTSLIKNLGISFYDASPSGNPGESRSQ